MRYPPSVALVNVIVKAKTRQGAMDDAAEIAQGLRTPRLGPGPCSALRPRRSAG